MTDHRTTLTTFLRTDLYRLEAALSETVWSNAVATRLAEHLQRLVAVIVLLTNETPTVPPVDHPDTALETLQDCTNELLRALTTISEERLHAPVLDRHDRNLTVLGHLYDYTRLSAMLVEWTTTLPPSDSVDDWFGTLDDSL